MFEITGDLGTDLRTNGVMMTSPLTQKMERTFHVWVRDSASLRLLNATKDLFSYKTKKAKTRNESVKQ